jgi:hypothetical protein
MMSSEWRSTAEQQQQDFANLLGDRTWDKFSMPSDDIALSKKIAFALLGPPSDENDDKTFGYSSEEWEKVTEIKEKCIENCEMQDGYDNSVCVAFIFVCAFKSGSSSTIAPLIRVKKSTGTDIRNSYFIDPCGRVYNTWKEYLEGNIFDGWWICVPLGAVYSEDEKVKVEFIDQSSRDLRAQDDVHNTNKRALRITKLMMSYIQDPVPIAWALNVVRAAVEAPGVAYGAGRSICEQVDHSNHDQSICLLDSEERALSVSRVAIVKSLHKFSRKKVVPPLDVLQLTAFVFFFTHSEVSFKAACNLIIEVQDKKLSEKRQSLEPDDQKVFDNMLKGQQEMVTPGKVCEMHGKVREMHGSNKFIRELNRIDNLPEFFAHFSLGPGTHLNINQILYIDAKAFFQMKIEERDQIVEKTLDLKSGKITQAQFDKNVRAITQTHRITFEHQRQEARKKIQDVFNVSNLSEIFFDGKRIFDNIQPHELDRLRLVFEDAGRKYNPDRIEVAKVMADILKCKNVAEFTAVMEYFLRKLDAIVKELRENNPNPKEKPSGVRSGDYYFKSVAKEFLSDQDKINAEVVEFNKLREACDAANNQGSPRFGNSCSATNHYDKHPLFPCIDPNNNLSPERYFDIAREMTNGMHVDKPAWTQEGNSLRYNFVSAEYGAMAVRFDNLADKTSVIATLQKIDQPAG